MGDLPALVLLRQDLRSALTEVFDRSLCELGCLAAGRKASGDSQGPPPTEAGKENLGSRRTGGAQHCRVTSAAAQLSWSTLGFVPRFLFSTPFRSSVSVTHWLSQGRVLLPPKEYTQCAQHSALHTSAQYIYCSRSAKDPHS
jgi:hypothetical protein